ncbi:MAG TPA: hypothetical protein VGM98_05060 [Schlesneria sp.]
MRTEREIRRLFFKQFPYMVVFEVLSHEIVILAVAHFSQKPNYWAQRGI